MTTNQITTLARAKILEESTEIIADATILIYANLTLQDIYKRAFPNDQILSATVAFSGGTGTLPTRFGTLYGDAYETGNNRNRFPELSIADFKNQTLSQAVTIEGGVMKVLPTTTASLDVKYYPTFPDMTADVNPTINSYFHEVIVYGIIYRAFEDLQDPEMATYYNQKYESLLNQRIAMQSNYEEENQRSGQMFEQQDLIGGISSGAIGDPNHW